MPTDKTKNLDITYIATNQVNKEILVNEGFLKIDSLLNNGAISANITNPPASPNESDLYIIPSSATDEWNGKDGSITYYHTSKAWEFITPNEGMTLWVNDEDKLYTYDGASWVASGGSGDEVTKLGINATADSINKLAVKSSAVLFDNDGDDSQVKINKADTSDTASHLFQTNYSGRAEFGLTGDDDFHVKVSNDGSSWNEALIVDKDNGNIHAKQGISFDDGTNILDFYQEGNWTPEFQDGDGASTFTHDVQQGDYVRIGSLVHCWGYISTSSVTISGTGKVRIAGFPFTSANNSSNHYVGSIALSKGFTATSNPRGLVMLENTNLLELYADKSSDPRNELDITLKMNNMNSGDNSLRFYICYKV